MPLLYIYPDRTISSSALNGVMIALAEDYCRRDEIEAAYFPYIIRKYRLLDGQENEALKTMLLDLLHESSIYCRENAMQALYTAGDPAVLVRALRIIDAVSYTHLDVYKRQVLYS